MISQDWISVDKGSVTVEHKNVSKEGDKCYLTNGTQSQKLMISDYNITINSNFIWKWTNFQNARCKRRLSEANQKEVKKTDPRNEMLSNEFLTNKPSNPQVCDTEPKAEYIDTDRSRITVSSTLQLISISNANRSSQPASERSGFESDIFRSDSSSSHNTAIITKSSDHLTST